MSGDYGASVTRFSPSPPRGPRAAAVPAGPRDPIAPSADIAFDAPMPRLPDDDIPRTAPKPKVRNVMLHNAARVLALVASVQAGRALIELPRLYTEASDAIEAFELAIRMAGYSNEQRQRAKYALCATIDDIALNLPADPQQNAQWARRALLVQGFQDGTGGERFWALAEDMLKRPAQHADLIELFHACLAAGFQGRLRGEPDGPERLRAVMTSLYAAMDHARTLSMIELSPRWRASPTPRRTPEFWSILALAGGAALTFLMVVYIVLRLVLMFTGEPALKALRAVNPEGSLRLSRPATPPPPRTSRQLQALREALAPGIAEHRLVVEEDGSTVRVRTTEAGLFAPGSDRLGPDAKPLLEQVAAALKPWRGRIKVEGYTDSVRLKSLSFPDNVALSKARAEAVAAVLSGALGGGGGIRAEGFGDARPVAPNSDAAGKALNQRVEIVIPRTS